LSWQEEETRTRGDRARKILESVGAFYQNDHIILTSARHASAYVNHDPLFEKHHSPQLSVLAALLAEEIKETVAPMSSPIALVGPMTGGWHLAHWAGYHYHNASQTALAAPAEKDGHDGFVIEESFRASITGRLVLLVDDVLTTGKSAVAAQKAVESIGGTVIGLLVVCDRSGKSAAELGLPAVWSLFQLAVQSWEASDCPMCKAGKPINQKVGHPEKAQKP
jgi:orotate phosphoribosyltransferase